MYDIYVIGIGYKPLDSQEREILYKSDIILSSERLLEVFKRYRDFKKVQKRVVVLNTVVETVEFIRSRMDKKKMGTPITVLASGDPLFFGIGRKIVSEFGKERVEVMPDLSCIQVAFSRIREPWDNAFLMSLHRGPDPQRRRNLRYEMRDVPALLARHKKLAILTDVENNPREIAKVLITSNISRLTMFVCEKLGDLDERITKGAPKKIAAMSFSTPNVVIILSGENG